MKQLSDIGEDALIERLISGVPPYGDSVIVGPGDDCAVVDVGRKGYYQLLKTDSLVEGVHFLPDAAAERVGWKAVARVISDFAAMGGEPDSLLVTIALPSSQSVSYVGNLYLGMNRCAVRYGAVIVGGETTTVPEGSSAMISISGTGWVRRDTFVTRSGGEAEDVIMVTGRLGGSIAGKHLDFTPRLEEACWLVENTRISAMMDLSDGVARDLPRLARASDCGYHVSPESLSCTEGCDISQALGDGEDYELLFTLPQSEVAILKKGWAERFPELDLSLMGRLTREKVFLGMDVSGWEHFTSS